ncbi:hypothetical protein F3K20_26970 [Streptomyces scabiei]|nr:hypothetical protein [Streptomyces sp. LBUM 1484]MBP5869280.1 hypothetical protein [Streptomyces sp. LBUM 1485]MBP5877757.1 hypothetical protein [Streptomyces sp. LBUM 1477]MBP5885592.1 hypothetical protein [Streptomyces sp. LBUM 1487]MBP5891576.1 hypothetical protein [Streptomyces sp. LBUM 1481]MBP5901565.1 hypothetical protein [Streptomyces sp. LBUM 1488]MBP5914787.1 hypothetical protein [Streptomyces sp. LBUM 1486]MBP5921732.1 hypothetical protein [Streptomyces sp. LBUM 1483]QTU47967.
MSVTSKHVAEPARLRDPIGAVEELIWNSVDADAGHVVAARPVSSRTFTMTSVSPVLSSIPERGHNLLSPVGPTCAIAARSLLVLCRLP